MLLSDFLSAGAVRLDASLGDKSALLEEAACALAGDDLSREQVTQSLAKRERLASTGVGEGIAIPHAFDDALEAPRLALVRPLEAVPFDAVDGQPVQLVFALLAPQKSRATHLRLLAAVARSVRSPDVVSRLLGARDPEEVRQIMARPVARRTRS